ncbi:A/G-specific adenine glycosylase [Candidatus Fermentibacteria bacterium]|nr:A/G-specific adenine glycosylase [Candidatus Fermentibacteria bacterium]
MPPPVTCTPKLDTAAIACFRATVYEHYRRHRRAMPWRETDDPYRILISEVMLQQTQVPRVMGKYGDFLAEFPDVTALAASSLARVLKVWQGLGYNRRAVALHRLARELVDRGGVIPDDPTLLEKLPGIGRATACAIAAFAFNRPVVFIETNIRSVFIHHFSLERDVVADKDLLPLVGATLDRTNPREWYWALMDYGSYLKTMVPNPSRRSLGHRRQSPFEGSNRQLRGRILRHLAIHGSEDAACLGSAVSGEDTAVARAVHELQIEGFVTRWGGRVVLGEGPRA